MPAFPLRPARVHEACGPSASGFALIVAQRMLGPVLWLREAWQQVELMPETIQTFLPPDRMLLASPAHKTDLLAVAEEALKDGAIKLVVLEVSSPLNLREGRRLQLAALTGATLGLCLLPEASMGSNAAETRWQCSPLLDPLAADSTLMLWQLIKNKSGTNEAWHVRWDEATHHLDMAAAPAL